MDILHTNCAGLDVQMKTVVATVIITKERGQPFKRRKHLGP
jgi:hypothetical protein